jgi:hypothetical protein
MERGSVQHGARIDDELAEGVEALVTGAPMSARDRSDLDPEAPTDDELGEDDLRVTSTIDAADGGAHDLDHDVVLDRSELARWLLPSHFPGDVVAIVEGAREEMAPDSVLRALGRLDPGAQFATFGEVWEALGGTTETREVGDAHEEPAAAAPAPDAATASVPAPLPPPIPERAEAAEPAEPAEPAMLLAAPIAEAVRLLTVPASIALEVGRRVVAIGRRFLPGG